MSDDFKAEGKVDLRNATIGDDFECGGGQFIVAGGIALDASSARIGSSVSLALAYFEGQVDFSDATINGIFGCDGAQFINKNGRALALDSAKIDRNLFLRGANFQGEALNAVAAQIQGNLFFSNGVQADGGVVFRSARVNGEFDTSAISLVQNLDLDMQFAKVGILRNDRLSWPFTECRQNNSCSDLYRRRNQASPQKRPGKSGGYAVSASHVSCIHGYQRDSVERHS